MNSAFPLVHGFPGTSLSHGAFGWSSLWLLQRDSRFVLLDTGPMAYAAHMESLLGAHGISPAQITDVLLTHAHWDHIANFTQFPAATVWIGHEELDWAATQPPGRHFLSDLHTAELTRRARTADANVETLSGEREFLPGITSISTPGHTPGHLAFLIESEDRHVVFAGDSVKNVYELHTRRAASVMDAELSRKSIERLRGVMAETRAVLIPGHDVALEMSDGDVVRQGSPYAQITVAHSASARPTDYSIGTPTED